MLGVTDRLVSQKEVQTSEEHVRWWILRSTSMRRPRTRRIDNMGSADRQPES